MGKEGKPVKEINWKIEYIKLAKKVSNDFSDVQSNYMFRRKGDISDKLDKLALEYQNIFNELNEK